MFHRFYVLEVWHFLLIICSAGRWPRRFEESANSVPATTGNRWSHRFATPHKKQQIISREGYQQTLCFSSFLYGRKSDDQHYFQEVVMNSEEKRKENVVEGEDEEKPFFKAAFDHFDWNHSSTIPTSVRVTPFKSKLKN